MKNFLLGLILIFSSTSVFACNYKLSIKTLNNLEIDRAAVLKTLNGELMALGYYPGEGNYQIKASITVSRDFHTHGKYLAKSSISLYKNSVMENYTQGFSEKAKSKKEAQLPKNYLKAIQAAVANLPYCNQ